MVAKKREELREAREMADKYVDLFDTALGLLWRTAWSQCLCSFYREEGINMFAPGAFGGNSIPSNQEGGICLSCLVREFLVEHDEWGEEDQDNLASKTAL